MWKAIQRDSENTLSEIEVTASKCLKWFPTIARTELYWVHGSFPLEVSESSGQIFDSARLVLVYICNASVVKCKYSMHDIFMKTSRRL